MINMRVEILTEVTIEAAAGVDSGSCKELWEQGGMPKHLASDVCEYDDKWMME